MTIKEFTQKCHELQGKYRERMGEIVRGLLLLLQLLLFTPVCVATTDGDSIKTVETPVNVGHYDENGNYNYGNDYRNEWLLIVVVLVAIVVISVSAGLCVLVAVLVHKHIKSRKRLDKGWK